MIKIIYHVYSEIKQHVCSSSYVGRLCRQPAGYLNMLPAVTAVAASYLTSHPDHKCGSTVMGISVAFTVVFRPIRRDVSR